MRRYLLDTSALIALRDDEEGADFVADLMNQARQNKIDCFACFMTLMEVFYRVWKDEGEIQGRLAYEQCQALPLTWLHEEPALLEKAAELKARYPISLADAWVAAAAFLLDAELIHKDPELLSIPCPQNILPYKK